ncbi:hypothetical protein G9A89_007496 [Geosiphon pyriformis]|nr:hypothetical protein G9A89_007496 [Geosiphon pyriformis]
MASIPKHAAVTRLTSFVQETPNGNYTIDPQSMVCRTSENDDKKRLSCVRLRELSEKEIFAEMQKLGFYCALAHNPNESEIQCRKI